MSGFAKGPDVRFYPWAGCPVFAKGPERRSWPEPPPRNLDFGPGRLGRTEMPTSFGGFLFWVTSIIAALIVVWVLWNFLWDWQGGAPIIRLPLLLIAGVIWLVGWGCRALA